MLWALKMPWTHVCREQSHPLALLATLSALAVDAEVFQILFAGEIPQRFMWWGAEVAHWLSLAASWVFLGWAVQGTWSQVFRKEPCGVALTNYSRFFDACTLMGSATLDLLDRTVDRATMGDDEESGGDRGCD